MSDHKSKPRNKRNGSPAGDAAIPNERRDAAAPSPTEIAARAYAIYLARGGADGRDQDDWLQAEAELQAK